MANETTTPADILTMILQLCSMTATEKQTLDACACTRETFGVDDNGCKAADIIGLMAEKVIAIKIEAAKDLLRLMPTSFDKEARLAQLPTAPTYAEHRQWHATAHTDTPGVH